MKKIILSAVIIIAVALVVGTSEKSQARAAAGDLKGKYTVKIDNFSFGPTTLAVPVGATVTWMNQDDVPHTIVSTDGKDIKSPVLDTDQEFSHAFAKAGTYAYYCSIHPKMTGKIIVQ